MKARNRRTQRPHPVERQLPTLGKAIEQLLLIEARHLDHPVDRFALAAKRQRSVRVAGDGQNASIDRRREALIDPVFRRAHLAASRHGR
jgi:hypothetical protein